MKVGIQREKKIQKIICVLKRKIYWLNWGKKRRKNEQIYEENGLYQMFVERDGASITQKLKVISTKYSQNGTGQAQIMPPSRNTTSYHVTSYRTLSFSELGRIKGSPGNRRRAEPCPYPLWCSRSWQISPTNLQRSAWEWGRNLLRYLRSAALAQRHSLQGNPFTVERKLEQSSLMCFKRLLHKYFNSSHTSLNYNISFS